MTDTQTTTPTQPTTANADPTPERLQSAFGDAVLAVLSHRGETTIVVRREPIVEMLRFLSTEPDLAYVHCSDVTVVDYLDAGGGLDGRTGTRYGVVYHLYSLEHNRRLRVRAAAPEEDPAIDSVVSVYPTANWFEREAFDLFGVDFRGHPDLKRILLPDEWDGPPPLRKDSPMGGEDVEFTFNVGRVHGRRSEI